VSILSKDIDRNSEEFIGVDLHVHTPASFCYKGEKNDAEYLKILRLYSDKNIKLIAITDHNTLKGYFKFLELKREINEKIKVLKPYATQYADLNTELEILESEYKLFEDVCILPGVEFEATPGIHLLFVFDPASDLSCVEQLLIKAGYTAEIQGREVPDILSDMDVIKSLNEAANLGAIIIAAHADSNKGIYNDLKPGNYRAQVFKSSFLTAISYKNSHSRMKMETWLQNEEYKRREPIAFIQSSDYHGGNDEPGACITYLKLKKIDFSSTFAALKNPNQCVSATVKPELADIINKIIIDSNTIAFENIDDSYLEEVKKVSCAILNRGFGTIIFGVKPDNKTIIGLNKDLVKVERITETLLSSIKPEFPAFVFFSTEYEYGNKVIFVIRLKSTMDVTYHLKDNQAFLIKSKNQIVEATPNELVHMSNERLLKRVGEFHSVYDKKISNVLIKLDLLRESSQQFALVNKIENTSLKLRDVLDINMIGHSNTNDINFDELSANGDGQGNVFLINRNEPRLQYAYLRYSVPRFNKLDLDKLGLKRISGKAIAMAPSGAVYYIEEKKDWGMISLARMEPTLILTVKKEFETFFSDIGIVAWLKSSLFLWYCYVAFGTMNPHNPKRVLNLPIPDIALLRKDTILKQKIQDIINCELQLLNDLSDENELKKENKSEMIERHNDYIAKIASEIDELFFKTFSLTKDDLRTIKSCFELSDLFFVLQKEILEKSTKKEINVS
jgi:hypothetical protein